MFDLQGTGQAEAYLQTADSVVGAPVVDELLAVYAGGHLISLLVMDRFLKVVSVNGMKRNLSLMEFSIRLPSIT